MNTDPTEGVRSRGMAPGGTPRTSCPLCEGTSLKPTLRLRDRQLLTCSECGVRVTDTYADGDAVADYYTEIEAHHGKLGTSLADRDGALRAIARDQADRMESLCGPRRFGTFLEIGCSRGHLLEEMQNRGWRVQGIEVSRRSAAEAAGRIDGSVHCGTPEDAPFAPGSMQRIAMFDVLAHLPEPRRTLAAVERLLAPGGELLLSTVNEDWRLVPAFLAAFKLAPARTAGMRDEMYEGQHYCYFRASNVGQLLESVGLTLHAVRPIEPLSTRFFVHQYGWKRRLALLGMVQADRLLRSSRKMIVLAKKPAPKF
ncbi:MAG: class I SAM-dependent methyltransferase [Deltaproteobacteria bacterium]|nr:class I SAM-dependent methyltransferase [Deltaproteobacteria bacterium]